MHAVVCSDHFNDAQYISYHKMQYPNFPSTGKRKPASLSCLCYLLTTGGTAGGQSRQQACMSQVRELKIDSMEMQEGWGQGPTQAGVSQSGSHFDCQTPDYWQNDTQLNFVRFSVLLSP